MILLRAFSRRRLLLGSCVVAAGGCAWGPAGRGRSVRGDEPGNIPSEPISPEALDELRTRIVAAHNTIRTDAKLRKLTLSKKLTDAAQAHADDMAARRKMSHTGSDGSTSAERVKARGYRYFRAGENVAYGQYSIDRLMKGWMDSPPHKKNILGGFSEIGVGCAVGEDGKRYWCVTFGLPSAH